MKKENKYNEGSREREGVTNGKRERECMWEGVGEKEKRLRERERGRVREREWGRESEGEVGDLEMEKTIVRKRREERESTNDRYRNKNISGVCTYTLTSPIFASYGFGTI